MSPYIYRPPEARQSESGRKAVVNGFKFDIYSVGLLGLEFFTNEALGKALDWEQRPLSWTKDLYPKIYDNLQVSINFHFRKSFYIEEYYQV